MRYLTIIFLLLLSACGPESSPEGRMGIKLDQVQKQLDSLDSSSDFQKELDSLKLQQAGLLDSINKLNQEIQNLQK